MRHGLRDALLVGLHRNHGGSGGMDGPVWEQPQRQAGGGFGLRLRGRVPLLPGLLLPGPVQAGRAESTEGAQTTLPTAPAAA